MKKITRDTKSSFTKPMYSTSPEDSHGFIHLIRHKCFDFLKCFLVMGIIFLYRGVAQKSPFWGGPYSIRYIAQTLLRGVTLQMEVKK